MFVLLHFDSSVFWVNHTSSHPRPYSTKTIVSFVYFWFILIVHRRCWVLYLFKLVWNTQKITWESTKARCFLILKMFLFLNAPPYYFFLHIFELKISNFYWPITSETLQSKIDIKFISKFWSNGVTPCKSFSSLLHSLCPMWVQSGTTIYLYLANFENKI